MSARNPLTLMKDKVYAARSKAYHVKKITNMDETVDFIYAEITALLSPRYIVDTIKAWIRDLITSKIEQTDYEQLDLWKGDYYWPIKQNQPVWFVDYVDSDGVHQREEYSRQADASARVVSVKQSKAIDIKVEHKSLKRVKQVALTDIGLPEIEQIEDRKDQNIKRAVHERNRFSRYAEVIKPILIANEGWTWGDAVRWLESQGPLPDLG